MRFIYVLLLVIFASCAQVQSGSIGLKKTWGKVESTTLTPGLHGFMPGVNEIVAVTIQEEKYEVQAEAASKDLQEVGIELAVNYAVVPAKAHDLYVQVGPKYREILLAPAVQEAIKAASSQFNAEQLITRREEVKQAALQSLQNRFATNGYLIITQLSIINFSFSKDYANAIEEKQVAEQNAQKAQQTLNQKTIEAQQVVVEATAEAEAMRLRREQLTPEILQLKQIETWQAFVSKWNGTLPQYFMGGGSSSFLMQLPPAK